MPRHEQLPGAAAARVRRGRPGDRPGRQPVRRAGGAEARAAAELTAPRPRERRRCYNARLFRDRPAPAGAPVAPLARSGSGRVSGEFHGRSTEQEVAFQARHAPRAQRARQAGHRHRADHGRDAPAPPHQPDRLLPRPQGAEDQGRSLTASPGRAVRVSTPGRRRANAGRRTRRHADGRPPRFDRHARAMAAASAPTDPPRRRLHGRRPRPGRHAAGVPRLPRRASRGRAGPRRPRRALAPAAGWPRCTRVAASEVVEMTDSVEVGAAAQEGFVAARRGRARSSRTPTAPRSRRPASRPATPAR